MTKKDYILIADVLAQEMRRTAQDRDLPGQWEALIQTRRIIMLLGEALQKDNSNFDIELFKEDADPVQSQHLRTTQFAR